MGNTGVCPNKSGGGDDSRVGSGTRQDWVLRSAWGSASGPGGDALGVGSGGSSCGKWGSRGWVWLQETQVWGSQGLVRLGGLKTWGGSQGWVRLRDAESGVPGLDPALGGAGSGGPGARFGSGRRRVWGS